MGNIVRRTVLASGVSAAVLLATFGPSGVVGTGVAATEVESGSVTYRRYCATCHGKDAKGDGPLAKVLRVVPPDLTGLARRNKGKFDEKKVARIIDGRDVVVGHGDSDMPAWGDAFKQTSEGYSEEKVKQRIDALVEHLRSLQTP